MRNALVWAVPVLAILLFSGLALAEVTLKVDAFDVYNEHEQLSGDVLVIFDSIIPKASSLEIIQDEDQVDTIDLSGKIKDPADYIYKPILFTYEILSSGTNTWKEYPEVKFDYLISASGTCTGGDCTCQAPYPCFWSVEQGQDDTGSIKGNEGGKFIRDGSGFLFPPEGNNQDTVWGVTINEPSVSARMSIACGGEEYPEDSNQFSFEDGWVRREITGLTGIPGSSPSAAYVNIEEFYAESLYKNFTDFGGGGGIYADGVYLNKGSDVDFWNNGTIIIKKFSDQASYTIHYLPPNGPRLCAYTSVSTQKSQEWESTFLVGGTSISATRNSPYQEDYTAVQLDSLVPAPDCPAGVAEEDCTQATSLYSARKKTGDVAFTFTQDPVTLKYSAKATTSSDIFTKAQAISTTLDEIDVGDIGEHTLNLTLVSQGQTLANTSFAYEVIEEVIETPGVVTISADYNDTIGLGENLPVTVRVAGTESLVTLKILYGTLEVGSTRKLGPVTFETLIPAPDLGANTFKATATVGGETTEKSFSFTVAECTTNETKPCGSNIGICKQGIRTCVNSKWSECVGETKPLDETCNRKDDNCDTVIDNVGDKTSIQGTKCGCYGNSLPSAETCNDIDDNCNGLIDEDLSCCADGETRSCGTSEGVCKPGIEKCVAGSWSGLCEGAVKGISEVCFDNLDNNCNGEIDENCDLQYSCNNGIQDANEDGIDCGIACGNPCGAGFNYLIFSLIGLLILVGVAIAAKKGKIKL